MVPQHCILQVSSRDVGYFTSVVGHSNVLTDPHELEPYNVDWLRLGRGQSKVVLKPVSTEEVSKILSYCNERRSLFFFFFFFFFPAFIIIKPTEYEVQK